MPDPELTALEGQRCMKQSQKILFLLGFWGFEQQKWTQTNLKKKKGSWEGCCSSQNQGIAEQLALRSGARVALSLPPRSCCCWQVNTNQLSVTLGPRLFKIQVPGLELRASWSEREAVLQRMEILSRRMAESRRVERARWVTTKDTPTNACVLCFPSDVLMTLPHTTQNKFFSAKGDHSRSRPVTKSKGND